MATTDALPLLDQLRFRLLAAEYRLKGLKLWAELEVDIPGLGVVHRIDPWEPSEPPFIPEFKPPEPPVVNLPSCFQLEYNAAVYRYQVEDFLRRQREWWAAAPRL